MTRPFPERKTAKKRKTDSSDNELFIIGLRSGSGGNEIVVEHGHSVLSRTSSIWPTHASFINGLVDAGFVILGGPLSDERRVFLAIEVNSEAAVRETLARGLWSETHLVLKSVDAWILRLDGCAKRSRQVRAGGRCVGEH